MRLQKGRFHFFVACLCRVVRPSAVFAILAMAFLAAASATANVPLQGSVAASSFGWNAEDATACLQAAIDSGAPRVVIDRQAGDWIVEPVTLRRSNQEVVIADGVTVRAKRGAFKRKYGDSLFTIPTGATNVTLRGEGTAVLAMNKRDYRNTDEYVRSESRHCISVRGATNVAVRALTILSSGGDGVCVGTGARHVRLDRLVCRDHHRQGISVIGAADMLVTNCSFDDTEGTAPMCGVDLEPGKPWNLLENIVFEDCTFSGNANSGIKVHLNYMDETSRPVSVTFRRCVSRGNGRYGIKVTCIRPWGRAVRGKVTFEECTTADNGAPAVFMTKVRSPQLDVVFRNCSLDAKGWASLVKIVKVDI